MFMGERGERARQLVVELVWERQRETQTERERERGGERERERRGRERERERGKGGGGLAALHLSALGGAEVTESGTGARRDPRGDNHPHREKYANLPEHPDRRSFTPTIIDWDSLCCLSKASVALDRTQCRSCSAAWTDRWARRLLP